MRLANSRVISTADLLESLDDIFLADFKRYARATHQLVNRLRVVTNHASVQLHELLCLHPVEEMALHGADLEAFIKDALDDFSSVALSDCMGFDQTKRAIVELGREA